MYLEDHLLPHNDSNFILFMDEIKTKSPLPPKWQNSLKDVCFILLFQCPQKKFWNIYSYMSIFIYQSFTLYLLEHFDNQINFLTKERLNTLYEAKSFFTI